MDAEQVIAEYKRLLRDLDASGATPDWRARRRLVNICLRSLIAEREYGLAVEFEAGTQNRDY